MKPNRPIMAAFLAVASSRARSVAAFMPMMRRTMLPRQFCACSQYHSSSRFHRGVKRQRHQFSLRSTSSSNEIESNITKKEVDASSIGYNNLSPQIFVDEVLSFLDMDGIPWRRVSQQELRKVLDLYFEQNDSSAVSKSANEMMTLLENRDILAVGRGTRNIKPIATTTKTTSNDAVDQEANGGPDNTAINKENGDTLIDSSNNQQPYSFILNLCPTPNLDAIQTLHQKCQHNNNSSVSQAVAAHAWLNTHLTNAFYNHDSNNLGAVSSDGNNDKPLTTIVHLHQDVWNRSPDIVQSRLRSKCGMFSQRIYGRQTIVKRIPKSEYIPFLEENHLWGATGAKFGYGLYLKPKKNLKQQTNIDTNDEVLVAVATFSSKRKIKRASYNFHSFELLRFCTKLDTTVVGGLTKLVAAFVKEVKSKEQEMDIEMDIITSIDRDFGSNTWPNFEQMEVMDPVPMFVENSDGLRRHAVGAGLTPLEQTTGVGGDSDRDSSMTTSMVLRAGLPDSLLRQLQQQEEPSLHHNRVPDRDWPWQTAARQGFHPVFDTGVERLMLVVVDNKNEATKKYPPPAKLWECSMPRYVKEHYSSNAGIENMLSCIRDTT